jgi:hypothetical protein
MIPLSVINQNSDGNIVYSLIADNGEAVANFDWRCTPNQRVLLVLVGGNLMFNCLRDHQLDSEFSVQVLLDNYRKEGKVQVLLDGIAGWTVKGTTVLCHIGSTLVATFSLIDTKSGIAIQRSDVDSQHCYYFNFFLSIPGFSNVWCEEYTPLLATYSEYQTTFKY